MNITVSHPELPSFEIRGGLRLRVRARKLPKRIKRRIPRKWKKYLKQLFNITMTTTNGVVYRMDWKRLKYGIIKRQFTIKQLKHRH